MQQLPQEALQPPFVCLTILNTAETTVARLFSTRTWALLGKVRAPAFALQASTDWLGRSTNGSENQPEPNPAEAQRSNTMRTLDSYMEDY